MVKSNIRVVFIFNWWMGSNGGGVKKHNCELVNSLKENYSIVGNVLYRNGNDDNATRLYNNSIDCVFQILYYLLKRQPRAIVVEGGIIFAISCLIHKVLVNNDCRLIYTFHTYPQHTHKIKKTILGILLRNFTYIVYVSLNLQRVFSALYGYNFSDKEKIIKPCIREIKYKSRIKSQTDEKKVLVVGLLSNKTSVLGCKLIIDALLDLTNTFPNLKILFTSDGRYKELIESYASSKSLDTYVSFLGYVEDLDALYSECDVFLYATYGTGMPLSIIEAMSRKCTIVASKIGGIPEIFEDEREGLYFNNTVEELSSKLHRCLSDSTLSSNFGNQAYLRFLKDFESIHLSKNYYDLIMN